MRPRLSRRAATAARVRARATGFVTHHVRSLVITAASILGVTVEQALEAYGVFFIQ